MLVLDLRALPVWRSAGDGALNATHGGMAPGESGLSAATCVPLSTLTVLTCENPNSALSVALCD